MDIFGKKKLSQECDTVVNKPFKVGMKSNFSDRLHQSFNKFRSDNPDKRPCEWAPKLKMSDLKPQMVRFVEAGLAALSTPEMTQTIIKAFQADGRFAKMRSPEMQLEMQAEIAMEMLEALVFVPDGVEEEAQNEDDDPATPLVDADDLSDDDDDDDDDSSEDDDVDETGPNTIED